MSTNFTVDDLVVLHEDNHIIVVVKPQNVPSCPDETNDPNLLDVIKEYLIKKYNKPGDAYVGLVHRLDRPTGGVMVYAKTSKAAARLTESMKNGEFEKQYLTVVVGKPRRQSEINVTNYLLKDTARNIVSAVPMSTEGAKKAVLDYNVLEQNKEIALLLVKLHTGRAHQIRVQLKTLGLPIFGDSKYGANSSPAGYNLALWAFDLKFIHPTTKEKMTFRVEPPTDEIPWKFFDVSKYMGISIKNPY